MIHRSLAVRERDGFQCQVCYHNQKCLTHHLKSYLVDPDLRYDIDNEVTLCGKCHVASHKQHGNVQQKISSINFTGEHK